jgi:hypothetical protein
MKVKIYLGEEIENLTPVAVSTIWRYRLSFRDTPADSTSFNFDTVKNGSIYTNIRKTFTTATTYDETYTLIGATTDDTVDNLLENLLIFNNDANITYALSEEVGIDGFYDINIDIAALPTDSFSINISGNSTSVVAIYGPDLIETIYETGTTVTSYSLLDLYRDENIEFTSKLSDIEKLSNVFTDFSNSFTVPATSNNNELFKHYYDVDIDNTFNANIRVKGYLEIDSFPLRFGKIQLESVSLKNQRPDSYKITFYGALIDLSDLFGDDLINLLDYDKEIINGVETLVKNRNVLSQFDFEYNSGNFINSINLPSFKDGDVITPLIAYADRDWNYGSNDAIDISTDAGAILDSELFQALRIIRIVEAIEAKYNISFSREFFGGATFNNLFMWMNGNVEPLADEQTINLIDGLTDSGSWSGPDIIIDDFITLNTTENYIQIFVPKIGTTVRDFQDVEYLVRPLIENQSNTGVKFKVIARDYDTDEILAQSDIRIGNDTTSNPSLSIKLKQRLTDYTVKIKFNIQLQTTMTYDCRIFINMFITPSSTGPAYSDRIRKTNPNTQTMIANRTISSTIPKMKVIDFLQGIMKMFKLIIRPLSSNTFYLNTLDGYYSEGNLLDITDYVNQETVTIERPYIYKNIQFKYQKTNNVLGKKFRETNDPINDEIGYGDLRANYANIESKNELKVDLPFENMLFEKLTVLSPSAKAGEITDLVIGQSISTNDEITFSKNNSKPILFFNNGITSNVDYPIKIKFGGFSPIPVSYVYLIGNTNDEILEQVTDTINWGAEIDPWHGQVVANSLYLNYWENWINTIYDTKQRKFTFDANLPPRYIEELSLNDRIIIGNQRYKINDYKINLLNGDTKLTLFKDIYDWNQYSFPLDINEPYLTVDRTTFTCNAGKKYYSININTNVSWTITKSDDGFGTDWVELLTPNGVGGSECVFIVEEKASQSEPEVYEPRTMILNISTDELDDVEIFITQNGLEE